MREFPWNVITLVRLLFKKGQYANTLHTKLSAHDIHTSVCYYFACCTSTPNILFYSSLNVQTAGKRQPTHDYGSVCEQPTPLI